VGHRANTATGPTPPARRLGSPRSATAAERAGVSGVGSAGKPQARHGSGAGGVSGVGSTGTLSGASTRTLAVRPTTTLFRRLRMARQPAREVTLFTPFGVLADDRRPVWSQCFGAAYRRAQRFDISSAHSRACGCVRLLQHPTQRFVFGGYPSPSAPALTIDPEFRDTTAANRRPLWNSSLHHEAVVGDGVVDPEHGLLAKAMHHSRAPTHTRSCSPFFNLRSTQVAPPWRR
jgi:hypothetical protein